jgi:hypothetical protein
VSRSKRLLLFVALKVFSLLSCYFGHLKLIGPAILHLLLGYVLADGFGVAPNRINEKNLGPKSAAQRNFLLLHTAAVSGTSE